MTDRISLHGSHVSTRHEHLGPAPADGKMSLTVLLRRKAALGDVTSATRQPPLTRAAFLDHYGLKDDDLLALRSFAATHGLIVGAINRAARSVRISGTVQHIGQAFGVSIERYRDDT